MSLLCFNKYLNLYFVIMNKLIIEAVEDYFNNKTEVILEGPSEKTWNKPGFTVSLSDNALKFFVALLSKSKKYDYILHFENYSDTELTTAQKTALFKKLADAIKPGEIVTTEGGVTPGGIHALKNLVNYGFEIIDTNKGARVLWATDKLLDNDKLTKWFTEDEHKDEFEILDDTLPITKENTRPIVAVLVKK